MFGRQLPLPTKFWMGTWTPLLQIVSTCVLCGQGYWVGSSSRWGWGTHIFLLHTFPHLHFSIMSMCYLSNYKNSKCEHYLPSSNMLSVYVNILVLSPWERILARGLLNSTGGYIYISFLKIHWGDTSSQVKVLSHWGQDTSGKGI